MRTMKVAVELPKDELSLLGELAERKHCTLSEMIEEAVAVFVGRQRERLTRHDE